MRLTITAALTSMLLSACLYDGEGTAGLPCNVDDDCGAQACIDQICGGASALTAAGDDEDESGEDESGEDESDERPTPQELPEPCEDGHQACIGSGAMEVCDNGKLISFECEWWCGMDSAPQGGCQADPRDGVESCWCESQGGPPSGTCGDFCNSNSDCAAGETCWSLTSGDMCAPSACGGCFDNGLGCTWLNGSCQFEGCG